MTGGLNDCPLIELALEVGRINSSTPGGILWTKIVASDQDVTEICAGLSEGEALWIIMAFANMRRPMHFERSTKVDPKNIFFR